MSGSNTIDFTGAKPVVDFAGARPTIDFTGATLTPEPMQSLEKMAEPVDLLAGFTPEKKQSIRDTFTSEEEAKHRMSQYLSSAMGLDEDWVRETYPVTSRNYGFTGDNATAHYAQTVNRLAKQWDRIQKTKEALGPKFRNTPLHKAIPQVRSQLDILAGLDNKDWITGVLNSGDVGMQQALNSIRSGLNKGAGAIDKVVVKAARKTAEAVGFDVDGDAKVSSPFDEFAEFWDNANEEYRINANIPKEIQESYRGQIAEGIGALPVWGIAMATGAPGQVALTAGLYDEAVTKYRNAVPEDEQSPMMELAMGLGYATVAARLEKLGFSKMLKPIFKGGGKLSLKQIANRGQQFAVGTGTETGTELLQTLLLNAEMMGIDPDARLFDELGLREFIVISSVSAFGTGGATSIGLVQDVATGFYPSPLTQDGSAPLHETIKEKANRVGVEALKEMHQEGDPRIDLIDDLVSENTEVAQKAEQQYIDLTIPEPKGEAYERVQEELTNLLRSESVARTVLEVSKETGFSVSDIEAFITESFGTTLNTESTEAFIETFGKQEGQKIESRVFDEIYKSFDGDFHYKSLNDVLDVIAKSNLPIAKIAKGLLGRHDDVKITVLKTREASSDVEENVGGSYNENNKRIKIHTRGNKDPRWLIHSIVHEALHAEFFKQLESSQGGSSWIFGVSSINRDTNQSLEDYKRELKEKFNTKGGIDNRAKPIVEVYLDFLEAFDPREGGLQKPYGMYSVHEFVSEALSSPRFQAELNAIKSKNGKSLWSKFVDAVASMLEEIGIDFDSKSMLAEALKAIEKSSNAEQAKRNRKTKKRGVPAQTTEAFGELFIKHIKLSEKQINKIQQALDVARGIKEEAVDFGSPVLTTEEAKIIQDDIDELKIQKLTPEQKATKAQQQRSQRVLEAQRKLSGTVEKRLEQVRALFNRDKNFREAVRNLESIVRSLPKKLRGELPAYFKKLSTKVSPSAQRKVLEAAEIRVLETIDRFRLKDSKAKFTTKVEKLQAQIVKAQAGKKRAGKKLNEVNKVLSLMGFGDQTIVESIKRQYGEFQDRLEVDGYVPTKSDEEIQFYGEILNVAGEGATALEYDNYLELLKELEKQGGEAWKLQQNKNQDKYRQNSITLTDEVEGVNDTRKKLKDPEEVKEFEGRFKQVMKALGLDLFDHRTISTFLNRQKRGKLHKFFERVSRKFSESLEMQHFFRQQLDEMAKRLDVNLRQIGHAVLFPVNGRNLSIHDAMFIYAHSQNEFGMLHLVGDGDKGGTEFGSSKLTAEDVAQIAEALPQKYKDYVDAIIDYHDTVMYPRLNDLHNRRFGINLPVQERYMPLVNLQKGDAFSAVASDTARRRYLKMNNMKARQGSTLGFTEFDFMGSVMRNNFASEHSIAMYDSLQEFNHLLADKGFMTAVGKAHPKMMEWMQKYRDRITLGKFDAPTSGVSWFASELRQNVSAYFISINVGSWAKTLGPLVALKKEIGVGLWGKHMYNPFQVRQKIRLAQAKSAMMRTRTHNSRIEIGEISQSKLSRHSQGFITRVRELAYSVYAPLDLTTTSIAWNMAYESKVLEGSEQNAIDYADSVVNTYFPSGRVDQLPALFTSGGLEKQLTTFTADMNKMLNLGLQTSQLKDRKIQEAVLFATFPIFLSALFLGLTDIPNDMLKEILGTKEPPDDRFDQYASDAARYGTSQVVGGIPFFGQGMEAVAAKATGDDQMARMLSQQNMVFFAPITYAGRDNYISAIAAASGLPGGNYYAPLIDDYIKEQFDD